MVLRQGLLIFCSIFLLSICLFAAAIAQPESIQAQNTTVTVSGYIAELDGLASSAKQLVHAEQVPKLLDDIPPVWRIETAQRTFEVSSEWLRQDLSEWQRKPSQETQDRIVTRLQLLRTEAASFQDSAADVSHERVLSNGILAGPEFENIHGPTWLDRLKQRAAELLIKLLQKISHSSSIPTISNVMVYGLMALALFAVAYWMYRTIRKNAVLETIGHSSLSISSKGWKVWMKEARLAAEGGNWRDAVHLAYWCGISFLEAQELWRPDRARTPREYLRLLPTASEHRETLGSLTRTFELVWYGTQEADANAFSETLAQLEKLGCQFN